MTCSTNLKIHLKTSNDKVNLIIKKVPITGRFVSYNQPSHKTPLQINPIFTSSVHQSVQSNPNFTLFLSNPQIHQTPTSSISISYGRRRS
ncbi:hypothetical protein QVD17_37687 [Tagetes erecta]|uniref:Uncharacterized protein n=1 Tax=Tagetes erecta TaxID=13708 RepID=A0AAD8JWI3_TARER|nr:hypothetical protein QVD17_37687 [Tagetes erecta]